MNGWTVGCDTYLHGMHPEQTARWLLQYFFFLFSVFLLFVFFGPVSPGSKIDCWTSKHGRDGASKTRLARGNHTQLVVIGGRSILFDCIHGQNGILSG